MHSNETHEHHVTARKAVTEVTATTEANQNSLSSVTNFQLMDNLFNLAKCATVWKVKLQRKLNYHCRLLLTGSSDSYNHVCPLTVKG